MTSRRKTRNQKKAPAKPAQADAAVPAADMFDVAANQWETGEVGATDFQLPTGKFTTTENFVSVENEGTLVAWTLVFQNEGKAHRARKAYWLRDQAGQPDEKTMDRLKTDMARLDFEPPPPSASPKTVAKALRDFFAEMATQTIAFTIKDSNTINETTGKPWQNIYVNRIVTQ